MTHTPFNPPFKAGFNSRTGSMNQAKVLLYLRGGGGGQTRQIARVLTLIGVLTISASGPVGVNFTMKGAGKGNSCCPTYQERLSCEHLVIPAAGIQHIIVWAMTLVSANTLAFALFGKTDYNQSTQNYENLFWEHEFDIWKRGRAIGLLEIHVSNSRDSACMFSNVHLVSQSLYIIDSALPHAVDGIGEHNWQSGHEYSRRNIDNRNSFPTVDISLLTLLVTVQLL